jgi:lactoylglutathione lyase
MHLAKNFLDIGLSTNNLAPILAFWQEEAGATFDHVLPIRPGHDQHRHDISGSVLKINHHVSPLPPNPPSGYRELIIAREGLTSVKEMADPEGNRVTLVPMGQDGVSQIAVRMAVRNLDAHRRFYGEALGFPEEQSGAFRAGESLILLEGAVRQTRTSLRFSGASRSQAAINSRHSRRAASRSDLNLALLSIFLW